MIKKILKIIGISLLIGFIGLIILGTIANIILIPDRKKSKTDQEMYAMANRLKKECPVQVGAYMYLTNVSFFNDTIRYNYEIRYNDEVEKFYSENTIIVEKLTKLKIIINQQKGWNSAWANLIKENNYVWELHMKYSDNRSSTISFNGNDLSDLLKELTSKEALESYLNTTLFLMNKNTPIVTDEEGNLIDVKIKNLKKIKSLEKKYQVFENAFIEGNNIVFLYSIPELQYTISDITGSCENPETIELLFKNMCSDPTTKEELTIFALAKCNLVLRYYGVKSKQSIDITIPYSMIRQHTYIPSELLEVE